MPGCFQIVGTIRRFSILENKISNFWSKGVLMERESLFLSLDDLKKAVQDLGIKSRAEYRSRYKEISGAPSTPERTYVGEGWTGCAVLFKKRGSKYRHGDACDGRKTPEYRSWRAMMNRCFYEKDSCYSCYGAAGVSVCKRWHTYENFLSDVGRKPSSQHTLGRIADAGDYAPTNAKWMSREEQTAERLKKFNATLDQIVGETFNGYKVLALAGRNRFGHVLVRARNNRTGIDFTQTLQRVKNTKSALLGSGSGGAQHRRLLAA
jgi:hypothetical protein